MKFWTKIKCYFGYHRWYEFTVYVEFYKYTLPFGLHRHCLNCHREQRKLGYDCWLEIYKPQYKLTETHRIDQILENYD